MTIPLEIQNELKTALTEVQATLRSSRSLIPNKLLNDLDDMLLGISDLYDYTIYYPGASKRINDSSLLSLLVKKAGYPITLLGVYRTALRKRTAIYSIRVNGEYDKFIQACKLACERITKATHEK